MGAVPRDQFRAAMARFSGYRDDYHRPDGGWRAAQHSRDGGLAMHFAGQEGMTGSDRFLSGNRTDEAHAPPLRVAASVALSCEVTSFSAGAWMRPTSR